MKYYILDLERTKLHGEPHYWKGNKFGYTPDIYEAGLFTKEEATKIVNIDYDKRSVMIPERDEDHL